MGEYQFLHRCGILYLDHEKSLNTKAAANKPKAAAGAGAAKPAGAKPKSAAAVARAAGIAPAGKRHPPAYQQAPGFQGKSLLVWPVWHVLIGPVSRQSRRQASATLRRRGTGSTTITAMIAKRSHTRGGWPSCRPSKRLALTSCTYRREEMTAAKTTLDAPQRTPKDHPYLSSAASK